MKTIIILISVFILLVSNVLGGYSWIEENCDFSNNETYSIIDLFNRADGAIGGVDYPSYTWDVETGTPVIKSNSAELNSNDRLKLHGFKDSVATEGVFETEFTFTSFGNTDYIVWFYDTGFTESIKVTVTSGGNMLFKNGAVSDDSKFDFVVDTYYRLRIKFDMNTDTWNLTIWDETETILYSNNSIDMSADVDNWDEWEWATLGGDNAFNSTYIINDTDGCPLIIPSTEYNTTLILHNTDRQSLVSISEDDDFYIIANFTEDTISIDGDCNFTAYDITSHFSNIGNNFTLSNSGSSLTLMINESTTNLVTDIYSFSVCRTSSKIETQIIINEVEFKEINKDVIPKCIFGSYTEIMNITDYISDTIVNFTLTCDGCNGGSKQIIVVTNEFNERLHYDRYFTEHFENMTYNTTTKTSEFTEYLYHYGFMGTDEGNITFDCNNETITNHTFAISDVGLSVDILSINDVEYTDGMELESIELTEIVISVLGDLISSLLLNVTYENGTLIKETDTTFIHLNISDLNVDGIYNISVLAIDDDDNTTRQFGFFLVNDTTLPSITWTTPKDDNTSSYTIGDDLITDISISDLNLFAYNLTINNGSEIVDSFQVINILTQTLDIIETILLNFSGIGIANLIVWDSHTKESINDFKIKKETDSLTFDNNLKVICEDSIEITAIKYKDRYKIKCVYDWDYSKERFKNYYVESNSPLYYIQQSNYIAHFVDFKNKKWIDFDGVDDIPYINKINDTTYKITFKNLNDNTIIFNSVGSLNNVSESVSFEVLSEEEAEALLDEPSELPTLDIASTSNMILLFIMLFFWLALMLLAFTFKNFGFASFGFFIGIILGFLVSSIHIFLTLLFLLMNIFIFIRYAHDFKH